MKIPPPSEAEIHCAVVQWLLAGNRPGLVFHHSPNEGKRGPKAQRWLKNSGTQKGWPDLEIFYRGRVLFLEIKRTDGDISPAQVAMAYRLGDAGHPVYLARSFEEATRHINEFIKGA